MKAPMPPPATQATTLVKPTQWHRARLKVTLLFVLGVLTSLLALLGVWASTASPAVAATAASTVASSPDQEAGARSHISSKLRPQLSVGSTDATDATDARGTDTRCADWGVVASGADVAPANYSELKGVAVVASDDAWAVGWYPGAKYYLTLTQHWDGVKWSQVPSPSVDYTQNRLRAVAATGPNDVWAVGSYYGFSTNDYDQTLILHWDGIEWNIVPSPNPPDARNTLLAVAATGTNDVWAVGTSTGERSYNVGTRTLAMHWNGIEWSIVDSPSPAQSGIRANTLTSVAALSAYDVWAVGHYRAKNLVQTLILHWDGTMWSIVPSPNVSPTDTYNWLHGVVAISTDDVWAVGYTEGPNGNGLILHWDGSSWSVVPHPSLERLYAITAVAANDVWAVGGSSAHWNGAEWSPVPLPMPSTSGDTGTYPVQRLYAVAAKAAGTDMASDASVDTNTRTENRVIDRSNTESDNKSGSQVWAVGNYQASSDSYPQGVIERFTPQFADVGVSNPFYSYIKCLACSGILGGYSDGTFRPGSSVTRGQLSKIVSNSAGFSDEPGPRLYQDVGPDSPFYTWINRLSKRGIMGGYACGSEATDEEPCIAPGNLPYFRPNGNATRGQIAKIVVNTAQQVFGWSEADPTQSTFQDVSPGDPYYSYVEAAYAHGVLGGYTCGSAPAGECVAPGNKPYFLTNALTTRGQTATIASNTFFPNCVPF